MTSLLKPPRKTGRRYYKEKLTKAEVLQLLKDGVYAVNENGEVVKDGKPIHVYTGKGRQRNAPYLFVRLYSSPKMIDVTVSHVVWMYYTGCVVPDGWEVHHRDLDATNNRRDNLLCLHPDDHKLAHGHELRIAACEGEVPF